MSVLLLRSCGYVTCMPKIRTIISSFGSNIIAMWKTKVLNWNIMIIWFNTHISLHFKFTRMFKLNKLCQWYKDWQTSHVTWRTRRRPSMLREFQKRIQILNFFYNLTNECIYGKYQSTIYCSTYIYFLIISRWRALKVWCSSYLVKKLVHTNNTSYDTKFDIYIAHQCH